MNHKDVCKLFDLNLPNLTSKIKKVTVDCYRVNIYQSYTVEESVIPRNRMIRSAFIRENQDGTLTDITI